MDSRRIPSQLKTGYKPSTTKQIKILSFKLKGSRLVKLKIATQIMKKIINYLCRRSIYSKNYTTNLQNNSSNRITKDLSIITLSLLHKKGCLLNPNTRCSFIILSKKKPIKKILLLKAPRTRKKALLITIKSTII
jgi:hypothetical protein